MAAVNSLPQAPPSTNEEPPTGQGQGFEKSQSTARALQGNDSTPTGLPWFRVHAEIVDDAKLRLLAYEDRWHFVALLAIKCSGMLDQPIEQGMRARLIAVKLGVQPRELEAIVQRLSEALLIDRETFQPLGWENRQYKSDSSKKRTQAYRARLKTTKRLSDVTVTPPDTDTDTDTEKAKAIGQRCAFAEFWKVYPKRVKRKPTLAKWKAKGLDAKADAIITDVKRRMTEDCRWLDGYIPDPLTYLSEERWTDELQPRRGANSSGVPTTPSPPAKDWRKSSESKLDNALAFIRQQFDTGALGEGDGAIEERDRRLDEARNKHGHGAHHQQSEGEMTCMH